MTVLRFNEILLPVLFFNAPTLGRLRSNGIDPNRLYLSSHVLKPAIWRPRAWTKEKECDGHRRVSALARDS
jgi:hypothetical protein